MALRVKRLYDQMSEPRFVISTPEALDYFKSRLVQAPRDVRHGLRIVRAWATTAERQRKVFEALAFKLEMLWAMIDTIHNAYRED